jgi:hypothetical protein
VVFFKTIRWVPPKISIVLLVSAPGCKIRYNDAPQYPDAMTTELGGDCPPELSKTG